MNILKNWMMCVFFLGTSYGVFAQAGFGFKYAVDFNHFFQAGNYGLVPATFSNILVGPFYKNYSSNGGVEMGVYFCHKGGSNGVSLPLVMKDFSKNQNTFLTAAEFEFKCGPRFGVFYPKTGYVMGYRWVQGGFWADSAAAAGNEIKRFYITVPVGLSVDLPTGFGTTGIGLFYNIGLTNVIQKPEGIQGYFDGSKMRSINVEITVMFSTGRRRY